MAHTNQRVEVINALLRGVGQVMFQNSSTTGLLFLVGIFLNSYECGLTALLGLVAAIGGALSPGRHAGSHRPVRAHYLGIPAADGRIQSSAGCVGRQGAHPRVDPHAVGCGVSRRQQADRHGAVPVIPPTYQIGQRTYHARCP